MEINTATPADLPRIRAIIDQYADLPADFAAASLVARCKRRKTTAVASVDADFTVCRTAAKVAITDVFPV